MHHATVSLWQVHEFALESHYEKAKNRFENFHVSKS